MKDKLRELAEMVREAYRAGFIAACKWPAPVRQDVDSSAYNREFNSWSFSVREKHAAILDAEGNGGAVSEALNVIEHWGQRGNTLDGDDVDRFRALADRIAPTAARSGVVSDEDVESAVSTLENYVDDNKGGSTSEMTTADWQTAMRAALEHFAKGERHEH